MPRPSPDTPARVRVAGILFLVAMVSYGAGSNLLEAAVASPELSAAPGQATLGAGLVVLNSLSVVAIPLLLLPILRREHRGSAFAYLAGRLVEAVLLVVGMTALVRFIELQQVVHVVRPDPATVEAARVAAVKRSFVMYQSAMIALGMSSLFLCRVLFTSHLVPRWLPLWGFAGYAALALGALLELAGRRVGVALAIPGGVFELVLAIWLLAKGLRPPKTTPA